MKITLVLMLQIITIAIAIALHSRWCQVVKWSHMDGTKAGQEIQITIPIPGNTEDGGKA